MYNTRNDRPVGRQVMIDAWFDKFIDAELYDRKDYYNFCKRVKGLTYLQIERIFNKEKTMG
jgi:hypothetical protein